MNLTARAKQLKTDIPALFIALKSRQTPWYVKAIAAVTVAYALSPIDIIPDIIPVLGLLDDVIILPALVALAIKLMPKGLFQQYQKQAQSLWQNGKPKKWYYAIPVIIVWLLVFWLIIKILVK